MKKNIEIFIGGSIDKNTSESYKLAAIELGIIINERKDNSIIFDGCFGLPFLVFNELDYTSRAVIYKTRYYGNDYIFKSSALLREFRYQSDFIRAIPEDADAMIFMKGGTSTITELMYAIETKKNKEHDKPIVVLNINNEWKDFVNLLDNLNLENVYYVTDNIIDSLNYIETELFKKESSYNQHFLQFMERKTTIIDESHSRILNRKSC